MMQLPEYARPAVGYAMAHLAGYVPGSPKKKSPEQVLGLLALKDEYAGMNDEMYKAIVIQAIRNLAASELAAKSGYNISALECFQACDECCSNQV